jgi:Arc/MetJ family transcription regulator
MRTNIDIDDELLEDAMALSALKTKKAVVEEALKAIVLERRRRNALKSLWGVGWEGNLEQMRTDMPPAGEQ